MIEVCELTKKYGAAQALRGVSFDVRKGEIVGFLGPNGAGKSTAMNIICGYIGASSGTVMVDGFEISQNPTEVKKRIGYLPEQPPLYVNMTVREYLEFVYDLKSVKLNKKAHIDSIEGQTGISDVSNRVIKNLSKGYRQRVGIAQALIGNSEVLILDEPSVGLDPAQIIEIRNLIKSLGGEHTVILSSHILSEVSAVCDRVIIINSGKIVAEGTPEELSHTLSGTNSYNAVIEGASDDVNALLMGIEGVVGVKSLRVLSEGVTEYEIEAQCDVRRAVSVALAQSDFTLTALSEKEMSLEEVFIRLTEDEVAEDETNDTDAENEEKEADDNESNL